MGNKIAFEKEPFPLDSIRWSKLKRDLKEGPFEPQFNSCLFIWQYGYKKTAVVCQPITLTSSFKLEPRCSYVLLHVYRVVGKPAPLSRTKATGSLASLQAFLQGARESLTPRGVSQTIGTTSKQYVPAESLQSSSVQLLHDFYIWNGKDAHPLARAGSLAGALKAEKKLKKKHYAELLRILFLRDLFAADIDPDDDEQNLIYADNRLFSQLLYQTISGFVQFLPSAAQLEGTTGASKPFPPSIELEIAPLRSGSLSRNNSGGEKLTEAVMRLPVKAGSTLTVPVDKTRPVTKPSPSLTNSLVLPGPPSGPVLVPDPLLERPDTTTKPSSTNWQELQRYFMPICSKITDYLYLGSKVVSESLQVLQANKITHILNCAGAVCTPAFPDLFKYRVLWLADGPNQDVASLFYEVLDWIEAARRENGTVFVHCEKGISRSSTMAICYLMWKNNKGFYPTHEEVKRIREVASPNANFTTQLLMWWERRRKPVTTTRVFLVEPHSDNDRTFVPKFVREPRFAEFTPDRCYIAETPQCIYIWKGTRSAPEAWAATTRVIDQFRRYETEVPAAVQDFSDAEPKGVTAETLAIKP